jgi:AcrR family transcriptional regulator
MGRRLAQRQETNSAARAASAEKPVRERLLDAADELFYRRGIHAVGIDEVIAAAGVAKMSLYRSFASKDDLVAAYLERRDAQYWRWWGEMLERHQGAPREQLRALFTTLSKYTTRPGWRGCPFTNAATEFPEREHPGRRVAEANKRALRQRLLDLAKDAGARDPTLLADQLVLLFEGAYSSALTFGSNGPAGAVAAAADVVIDAQLP